MTEHEPTPDQLEAMAFVDGELSASARSTFEARLNSEPALLAEVAELRSLAVIARQVSPPEPMDYEWERMDEEFVHGTGMPTGLLLSAIGALGLLAWMVYLVLASELDALPKMFFALLVMGLGGLFLLVLRARLRTRPLDPYTHVKR